MGGSFILLLPQSHRKAFRGRGSGQGESGEGQVELAHPDMAGSELSREQPGRGLRKPVPPQPQLPARSSSPPGGSWAWDGGMAPVRSPAGWLSGPSQPPIRWPTKPQEVAEVATCPSLARTQGRRSGLGYIYLPRKQCTDRSLVNSWPVRGNLKILPIIMLLKHTKKWTHPTEQRPPDSCRRAGGHARQPEGALASPGRGSGPGHGPILLPAGPHLP